MALLGAPPQRIGYFGPTSSGIVTMPPRRPVDIPPSQFPPSMRSQPPSQPVAPGQIPAAAPPAGQGVSNPFNARELAAAGQNRQAFNLWSNRHPAAVAAGKIPGWVGAAGRASRLNPGSQPNLSDLLAAAAAAHPVQHQLGPEQPGAGVSLPPQAGNFAQLEPILRAIIGNPNFRY